jgi:hypothetical protein
MTEKQKIAFIKNKLAPLFDGMNAKDALEIIEGTYVLRRVLFSRFTLSSDLKKK